MASRSLDGSRFLPAAFKAHYLSIIYPARRNGWVLKKKMNHLSIISSLEQFQKLFPVTRLEVFEDEMHYRFRNLVTAKYFESYAQRVIIENKLPITAVLEIWESGGYVHEISLVVKLVPEEHLIVQ